MLKLLIDHLKTSKAGGAYASTPGAGGGRAFDPDEVVVKGTQYYSIQEIEVNECCFLRRRESFYTKYRLLLTTDVSLLHAFV